MKINEECQLIVNSNSQKKNNNQENNIAIKKYPTKEKSFFSPFYIIITIIIIIIFIFIIKNLISSPKTISTESNNDSFTINNQTLINELKTIINSFEMDNIITSENKEKISTFKNPQISVIIPIYNNAEKIKLTIHSIQNQNVSDLEIIIIDDNSQDNSVKIIEQLQQEDPRIKLLKNKNNKGILYTRSIGVFNSKGKYIFPINSGDMFINDIINTCYNEAELNNLDIVEFSGYNFSNINSNSTLSSIINPNFLNYREEGQIIMQPELSGFMYKEKNESLGYDIIDQIIWGKCIKNNIYKNTIDMLNFVIFTENLFFFESQIINFGLFKTSDSFKFINKNGVIHIHNMKNNIDNNQFFHDYLKYVTSLYKITQKNKNVQIAVFEFENVLNLNTYGINEENKKLTNDLYKEIKECNYIFDDKKQELEIKIKNFNYK